MACDLEGPFLGVEERAPVEQAAIAMATENAYPHAEAVASVMTADIAAVEKVTVVDVAWNRDPATRTTQPDIRHVTCTAKVKVSYLCAGPQS